ncbi:MAG: acyl carrier protein [Gammaproteobacteria bacterium]|nr:acyl carrier protein [Gammaproteobacteria bacterium]
MTLLDEVAAARVRDQVPLMVEKAVRTLYEELHHAAPPADLAPQTRLDADLGFDSLARIELLERLQRASSIELPESALEWIQTVADLVDALRKAQSTGVDCEPAALHRPSRSLPPSRCCPRKSLWAAVL